MFAFVPDKKKDTEFICSHMELNSVSELLTTSHSTFAVCLPNVKIQMRPHFCYWRIHIPWRRKQKSSQWKKRTFKLALFVASTHTHTSTHMHVHAESDWLCFEKSICKLTRGTSKQFMLAECAARRTLSVQDFND